jgi:asparagine synthase (glutamine-hydrolysing)
MCGIVGILGKNTKDKEAISLKMAKEIFHRGPDQDGFFSDEYLSLGMRRLSIIDLKTGKQPIESEDGNSIIFFNGEIYNYKELKEELLSKGVRFKTETDTEVILYIYQIYGVSGISKLRGMFAFCIYDKNLKSLFLARDFFGIKPLYFIKQDGKILGFASEIKALLVQPEYKKEVNDNAVFNYLRFQYNPLNETFFKNIYKLEPASYLKIDLFSDTFEFGKYWDFQINKDDLLDLDSAKNKIREVVKDSVRSHMISDVKVGSFLSGGVDSSIIATCMKEVRDTENQNEKTNHTNKTFTIGFDAVSEGQKAKETSDFLKTDHKEIIVGPDEYFKNLRNVVWHFDEPVADPSAVGLYFLAREARKDVKVILSGEGADELFGGYNIYLTPISLEKLKWVPTFLVRFVVNIFNLFGLDFWGTNYLRRLGMKLENWYFGQKYFNKSVFQKEDINKLWIGEKQQEFSLADLYKTLDDKKYSDSEKMQIVDVNTWLVGDILAKADKMTMAHSIELRVPFLDTHISDIAGKLAPSLKWKNSETKYALREAFKGIIPETARSRKKLGFPVPIKNWLTKERKDIWQSILDCTYIKSHLDIKEVRKIIENHLIGKQDNSRKIYILYLLSIWYSVFIENKR